MASAENFGLSQQTHQLREFLRAAEEAVGRAVLDRPNLHAGTIDLANSGERASRRREIEELNRQASNVTSALSAGAMKPYPSRGPAFEIRPPNHWIS
jgi:hypothetical protein